MHKHNGMMTYAGEGANLTLDTSHRKYTAVLYIHFAPRRLHCSYWVHHMFDVDAKTKFFPLSEFKTRSLSL
jgi:hypothetical protein